MFTKVFSKYRKYKVVDDSIKAIEDIKNIYGSENVSLVIIPDKYERKILVNPYDITEIFNKFLDKVKMILKYMILEIVL